MDSLYYKDQGKGHPLVLLHGFCETHQIWDGFAEELAKDFRVITPDLPGFGKSKLPIEPFTINDIGSHLANWLSEENIVKPVVIGHSLGGYIALAVAQKNPHLLAGLGLFHSTAFADSEEKKINRNKTIDFVKKNGVAPFVETFVPGLFHQKGNAAVDFVSKIALATPMDTLVNYSEAMRDRLSSEEFLKVYDGHVLVAAGIYDSIITYSASQQVSKLAPKTMFRPLQNTGHMGMFESPKDSVNCFREFVLWCKNGQQG
jgi:pimeloyl-ACP methyl ester carboxylesterase